MQNIIERYFIWIILLFSSVALVCPYLFIGFKALLPIGLAGIIFCIGMNTSLSSFKNVLAKPANTTGLIVLRFLIMPLWALIIAYGLDLTQIEKIGLLVLATSPGGTAANVMAYLSKANVALAIVLTFGSTLFSPIITPGLIYLLLHKVITIQFWPMVQHISVIVLCPLLAGVVFNYLKSPLIEKFKSHLPTLSIFLIALLIATLVALNQDTIILFPAKLLVAVVLLNLLGYVTGSLMAYLTKHDRNSIIAATFDYGMFDAVVAMLICTTFFNKEAAIPTILMSVVQNLTAPMIVRHQKRNIAAQSLVKVPE